MRTRLYHLQQCQYSVHLAVHKGPRKFVGLLAGLGMTHIVVVRRSLHGRCSCPGHPVLSGRQAVDYEE